MHTRQHCQLIPELSMHLLRSRAEAAAKVFPSKLDCESTNLEVVGVDSTELRPPAVRCCSPPLWLPPRSPPGPDFQPMGA